MRRKAVWLVVCCLMALSLVMTSCGKAEETQTSETPVTVTGGTTTVTTGGGTTTTTTTTTTQGATVDPEKPRYGGTLRVSLGSDIVDFDEVYGFHASPATVIQMTHEELWTGDWSRGPAGTGEVTWDIGGNDVWEYKTGAVVESWNISQPDSATVTIRKGIHWAQNGLPGGKLVNGRELTADDVYFTLTMYRDSPRAYLHAQPGVNTTVITLVDDSTVKFEFEPGYKAAVIMRYFDFASIVPREVYEVFKDDARNWDKILGSGAFMITDFVQGSGVTLKKNPNWWRKNPCGKGEGDKLPYLDGINALIIPDASTAEAAFRTGKLDRWQGTWETGPQMLQQRPDAGYSTSIFDGGFNTHFNIYAPPFDDVNVRRAMMMAIDWDAMVNDLFGGEAEVLTWPVTYNSAYGRMYLGIDDPDCPDAVKELYVQNLAEAKTLMTDAGYPNGFTTTVICPNTPTTVVDYYSVLANDWAEINITLNLDVKEYGTHTSIYRAKTWTELCYSSMGGLSSELAAMTNIRGAGFANASSLDEPKVEETYNKVQQYLIAGEQNAAMDAYREMLKWLDAQVFAISYPKAPGYTLWQPWVKNYHGENSIGNWNTNGWVGYIWYDTDLKKQLGY